MPNSLAPQFRGVETFMAALAGGEGIGQTQYNASTQRLIEERSRRALMDKRVSDATKAGAIADAFISMQERQAGGPNTDVLIGGRGSDFLNLSKTRGQEIKNEGLEVAMDALRSSIAGGTELPIDEQFNPGLAISRNAPLTATQVLPKESTEATIGAREAQAALAGDRRGAVKAQIENIESMIETREKNTIAGKKARRFTDTERAMLFPPDASGRFVSYQEFRLWQGEQELVDPKYGHDDLFAYTQWMNGVDAVSLVRGKAKQDAVSEGFAALRDGGGVAGDPQGEALESPDPTTGAQTPAAPAAAAAPAQEYPNIADAKLILSTANAQIAAGADYKAVMAIVRAEFEKLGIPYD